MMLRELCDYPARGPRVHKEKSRDWKARTATSYSRHGLGNLEKMEGMIRIGMDGKSEKDHSHS